MDRFFERVVVPLLAGLVTLAFGLIATSLYMHIITWKAEKLCLQKGFPKYSAAATYDGDVYCMSIDGAVTIKVEKQK